MKGPLPATILISPGGKRDRIDNDAAIEFILSGGRKVRVGFNPETGNLLIIEFSETSTTTKVIKP